MGRRRSFVVFLLLTLSLDGCATPPPNLEKIVPEARAEEPIQGLFMTCKSAYALTQDCKTLRDPLPQRMIVIGNLPILIAGSADGKVVLVTPGFTHRELKARSLTYSPASAQVFEAVKEQLFRVGVQIVRARAILLGSLVNTYAVRSYALELDGDGYTPLKTLSATP